VERNEITFSVFCLFTHSLKNVRDLLEKHLGEDNRIFKRKNKQKDMHAEFLKLEIMSYTLLLMKL